MKDISNERYGRWLVIRYHGKKNDRHYWLCRCDCGIEKNVIMESLLYGRSTSCGCYQKELASKQNTTHGHTMRKTHAYNSWSSMLTRCSNKNAINYQDYGGRGITVCDRWKTFKNFFDDMGERPEGLSLDRINNELGYYKENCRWATRQEQACNMRNNRLIIYQGKEYPLATLARENGLDYHVLTSRIMKYGWPIDVAVNTPNKGRGRHDNRRTITTTTYEKRAK